MLDEILDSDATEQARLVAEKQVSALQLVDAAIARIERLEPTIHALASSDFEAARERAKQPLTGALAGVPFLIKDLLSYPGQRCMLGSRLFAHNIASEALPYAQRLTAAGLITLGKTTTSELGLLGSTETLLSGVTHNPWDLTRSATGSSGGSAAAVAAGMVAMAHASDGGGSIRIPSSACGLFGFTPSRGRCVPAMVDDLDGMLIEHVVSRTVRDSALLLSITENRQGPLAPVGMVKARALPKLRIGFYEQTVMHERPHPEVRRALHATASLLRELGHEVDEVQPPKLDGERLSAAWFTVAGAGVDQLARMIAGMLGAEPNAQQLEPFTLALREWYRSLPEGSLADAKQAIQQGGATVRAALETLDVVLCPTIPILPPPLGTLAPTLGRELLMRRTETLAGYTSVFTMGGVPSMSVPLHASEEGLPIGMQFAAAMGRDDLLLALAYQLEEAAPWSARRAKLRA